MRRAEATCRQTGQEGEGIVSVVTCPLCGARVNAGAARCPDCGADIHLGRELALAELLAREGSLSCPLSARPAVKAGWSRSWRILTALPALIAPAWLIALSVRGFAREAHWYFSLPGDERAGGGLFSADIGMRFAGFAIAAGLLLALVSVSVALPRRLRLWWGLAVSLMALGLVWLLVTSQVPAGLAFLYLPALAALRMWWQHRVDGTQLPSRGNLASTAFGRS
jgi:hypothetical protein